MIRDLNCFPFFLISSIKKKVKGGSQAGSGSNCKTLPGPGQAAMQTANMVRKRNCEVHVKLQSYSYNLLYLLISHHTENLKVY